MPQVLDRFRSSTLGWLIGTLAGWGTCFLLLLGLVGTFYFLAQGMLAGAAWVAPLLFFGLIAIAYAMTRKLVRGTPAGAGPESPAEGEANYR